MSTRTRPARREQATDGAAADFAALTRDWRVENAESQRDEALRRAQAYAEKCDSALALAEGAQATASRAFYKAESADSAAQKARTQAGLAQWMSLAALLLVLFTAALVAWMWLA